MNNKNAIVEVEHVSFSYRGQYVLEDVDLTVKQGDYIAMIGPNGGGKTTLLKLILGLFKPSAGSIRVIGGTTRQGSRNIGYVPQNVHINQNFPITAMDVVLMGKFRPEKRFRRNAAGDRREAKEALERMEMGRYADTRIGELSGGQRQRVLIARALVSHPPLLLLDEPTASIDTKGQAEFYTLLKQLNSEITIVVVSHDLLVISSFVKSVACVNKRLHYHDKAEITSDMLETMYPCEGQEICPVELIAHGLPHRVLKSHGAES